MDHVTIKNIKCLAIEHLKGSPPTCSCSYSSFNYIPAEHVITGDVNIVNIDDFKSLIFKGQQFRKLQSFNWHYNFTNIMNLLICI